MKKQLGLDCLVRRWLYLDSRRIDRRIVQVYGLPEEVRGVMSIFWRNWPHELDADG